MNILDYTQGALNTLSPKRQATTEEQLIKLHDILHHEFYQLGNTAFEVTITFDEKKIQISQLDDIHLLIKATVPDNVKVFLIREFSETFRPHYHGIILCRNQSILGKYQATLKRLFGRMCRIRHITYPLSYIPYMLKDLWSELELDYTRMVRTFLLTDIMDNLKVPSTYTRDMINDLNARENKK